MKHLSRIGAAVAIACVACGGSPPSTGSSGATPSGTSSSSSTPPPGPPVGSFGDADGGAAVSCSHDSDCPAGSRCVIPTGTEGAGVGTCTPVDGGPPPPPTAMDASEDGPPVLDPIDPVCVYNANAPAVYPPYVPLYPPDVPAACDTGFQLNDAHDGSVYTIDAKAGGAAAITLDVDYATYVEPNGLVITGIDGSGSTYTLMDSCRLQTWTQADPSGGDTRPLDVTIRQFHVPVRAGTTQLAFTFHGGSPMYLQVVGLCDFDVTSFASCRSWRTAP